MIPTITTTTSPARQSVQNSQFSQSVRLKILDGLDRLLTTLLEAGGRQDFWFVLRISFERGHGLGNGGNPEVKKYLGVSMQGIIPDILQRMKSASHSIISVRAYQGNEISVVSVPAIQGDEISIISARTYHGDETSIISAPNIVHLGTEVRHRSSWHGCTKEISHQLSRNGYIEDMRDQSSWQGISRRLDTIDLGRNETSITSARMYEGEETSDINASNPFPFSFLSSPIFPVVFGHHIQTSHFPCIR